MTGKKDPFPFIKLLYVKGYSNKRFFKRVTAFFGGKIEDVLISEEAAKSLKEVMGVSVPTHLRKEIGDMVFFAERALENIYDGKGTAKKFVTTLKRIIERGNIFLSYLKRGQMEPRSAYTLMQDTLILKDLYIEFLEDIGRKLISIMAYGIKPKDLAELRAELEPFRNNSYVKKILNMLDKFEEKMKKPIANAYLTLSKDEERQKNIHQLRLFLKRVG